MTLDPVKMLARTISGISAEQDTIKQNMSADESDSQLVANFSFNVLTQGTVTATSLTYATDSFILDHPVYGNIDNWYLSSNYASKGIIGRWDLGSTSDYSGNNRTLTTFGSPTLANDMYGNSSYAYSFNGSTDYFSTGYTPNTASSWSVSAFINQSSVKTGVNNENTCISADAGAATGFMICSNRASSTQLTMLLGNGNLYSFPITLGTWYHVGMSYNSTNAICYVNGASVATLPGPITSSGAPLLIGARNASFLRSWAGSISECLFSTSALTSSDMLSLYLQKRLKLDGGYQSSALFPFTFPIVFGYAGSQLFSTTF